MQLRAMHEGHDIKNSWSGSEMKGGENSQIQNFWWMGACGDTAVADTRLAGGCKACGEWAGSKASSVALLTLPYLF